MNLGRCPRLVWLRAFGPPERSSVVSVHNRNIVRLVDSMAELLAAPKRPIGFVTPQEDKPNKPASSRAKAAGKKT